MRRTAALLLVIAAACARPQTPAQKAEPPALEVDVTSNVAAHGRLVVSWRTPSEQAEVDAGHLEMSLVRAMVERSTPKDEIDFAKTPRVRVRIDDAPPHAVAVIFLDVDHTFWETFVGGGHGLVGTGTKEVRLAANPTRPPKANEPCSGERYRLVTIDAPELAPATSPRRFCAWLPKSWASSPERRYPVVLMFPGLMSNEMSYLRGDDHLGLRIDQLDREAVLVGVDTSTPIGSTYLEDAPAIGPWATFLATRALPEIERELHGLARRSGRAVIGQSTGGFNALSFGMRRSDLFAAIGASSPDPPNFEPWLFDAGKRRAKPWVHHWLRLEATVGGAGQMTSWAAAFSGSRWPFDPTTGARNDAVFAEWAKHSPHGLLYDKASLERVKRDLRGRILVTVGRKDEFDLYASAERFVKELEQNGLEPTFVPTDEGHGNQNGRLETALRYVLDRLDRDH